MTWTRERKMLLAVLCLGAGALIVDRTMLSSGTTGPSSAVAEATAVAGVTQAAVPSAPSESDTLALLKRKEAGPMLSERLKHVARAQNLVPTQSRDAFQPPVSWVGEPEPEQAVQPVQATVPDPAERFREAHRVMAVMTNRGQGVAIVNGAAVHVGEQLDGFTLERVEQHAAVFVSGRVRVELAVVEAP